MGETQRGRAEANVKSLYKDILAVLGRQDFYGKQLLAKM